MNQEIVTQLVDELNISEDLVRMAVQEAEGELVKAREILDNLQPSYLIIKVKFVSQRPDSGGGLICVVAEKNSDKFVIFRVLYENNREWVDAIQIDRPPDVILRIIKEYFNDQSTSVALFDARKLNNDLSARLKPVALQYIFEIWDTRGDESELDDDPTESFNKVGVILTSLFKTMLEDILIDRVDVDLDFTFYTTSQFNALRDGLGLLAASDGTESAEKKSGAPESEGFKVHMKGQFSIDPVSGTPVYELEVGDTAYCEVLDRSEVAMSVGRIIGAFHRGMWFPVRGKVMEIKEATSGSRIIKLKIAKSIYVNILSIGDIKVRISGLSPRERIREAEKTRSETSMIPILIAVGLLAFLVIVLAVLQ